MQPRKQATAQQPAMPPPPPLAQPPLPPPPPPPQPAMQQYMQQPPPPVHQPPPPLPMQHQPMPQQVPPTHQAPPPPMHQAPPVMTPQSPQFEGEEEEAVWEDENNDGGWKLQGLRYNVMTAPTGKANNFMLYCCCGKRTIPTLGSISCLQGLCKFSLPSKPAVKYYAESVFHYVLGLPGSANSYMGRGFVLWLTPICKCGQDLSMLVYLSKENRGHFWYAKCFNANCDVEKLEASKVKYLVQSYLEQYPNVKAELMSVICK